MNYHSMPYVETNELRLLSASNNLTHVTTQSIGEYNFQLPTTAGASGQVLSTDGTGVLSWAAGGGAGSVTSVAVSGGSTIFTTSGGPITGSGTITLVYDSSALPVANGGTGLTTGGSNGNVLTWSSGAPAWVPPATSGTVTSVAVSGGSTIFTTSGGPITGSGTVTLAYNSSALPVANGGTGLTTGGSNGNVLTWSSGAPAWVPPATSGTVTSVDVSGGSTIFTTSGGPITGSGTVTLAYNSSALPVANGGTGLTTGGSNGNVLTWSSGAPAWVAPTLGTVTSVALTVPSVLQITSGSPITGAGTIAIGYSSTPLPTANGGTGVTSASTGTGGVVLSNTPTLITPVLGAATGTSINITGSYTSTVSTGTAPIVVSSSTNVVNLNASYLTGNTWAIPGTIGSTTPNSGAFTTVNASSYFQSGNTGFRFFVITGTTGSTYYPTAGSSVSAPLPSGCTYTNTISVSGILIGSNGDRVPFFSTIGTTPNAQVYIDHTVPQIVVTNGNSGAQSLSYICTIVTSS